MGTYREYKDSLKAIEDVKLADIQTVKELMDLLENYKHKIGGST